MDIVYQSVEVQVQDRSLSQGEGSTVIFNVGGTFYEVYANTLLKHPNTTLARLLVSKPYILGSVTPVFIDRDGGRFKYILDWYRDGVISLPLHLPVGPLCRDIQYFGLPDDVNIVHD
jgi:hypothetical protein